MKRGLRFFFIFLSFVSIKGFSQTNVTGVINKNTVWTTAGSPYVLTGTVEVQSGVSLTIEPGVTVKRSSKVQLTVFGVLTCAGTQADSIYFTTTDLADISTPPFIQFQKTDLSNSTLRFLSFKSLNSQTINIRVGSTNESGALIKNSGILSVGRSNFSYGTLVTRGYNSAISMNLDSCYLDSCNVQSGSGTAGSNNFYYSEKINIYNSTINNSSEVANTYSFGLLDSNCTINNSIIEISSNTNTTILASNINNSSLTVNGSPLNISHSTLVNSPIFGIPGGALSIDASEISANNPDTSLYPRFNGVSYLIATAQANITGATFKGIPEVDAIVIQGASADTTTDIIHNTFTGFGDAVTVSSFSAQMHVDSNNFETVGKYDIINYSDRNFNAVYDYFQLADGETPADLILDHNDNINYGYVFYIPYATGVLPLQLISFTGAYHNSQVILNWQTANEVNTSEFTIQHLINGNYQDIGKITAKGGTTNTYTFSPGSLTGGVNIYRLKMIDKDGGYSYSAAISVDVSTLSLAFMIYPNPATHYVLVNHAKAEGASQLQLADMTGKIIKTVLVAKDDIQNKIVTDGIAKGTYKVIWRNGAAMQSQTILIQ